MRKWLTNEQAESLGLTLNNIPKGRKKAKYRISEQQWNTVQSWAFDKNPRDFVETQKKYGKNGEVLSTVEKLQSTPIDIPDGFEVVKISTSQSTGQQWVQYKPKEEAQDIAEIDFEAIIKKHIKPVKDKIKEKKSKVHTFDMLTYTDVHIGMETDKYDNAMYAVDWSKESIMASCTDMAYRTVLNKKSDVLYVDDLGDFLDGYNAQTTRGGHDLPQNMTNEQAFDCAIDFKMHLIDNLVNHYDKIVFNNVCNDNHAGAFGYFANKTFKDIAEIKYPNVIVNNHRTFLSHYFVGDICFVISHGKDDKSLKFGFKPHLDPKQIEKIDQYLKRNNIYGNCKRIIFKKGDSHQALFDMSGSDDFDYYNYPALSPSSQWVQTNFKKGRRGFVLEHFKGINNTINPYLK